MSSKIQDPADSPDDTQPPKNFLQKNLVHFNQKHSTNHFISVGTNQTNPREKFAKTIRT
jgi:hypothetical protein